MSRLVGNRWFRLSAVLVFSLIGLMLVTRGDANARVTGWASLLLFGLGGGVTHIGEFVAGRPRPLERRGVRLPDGTTASAMVLAYPRHPAILRTLAGIATVAGLAVFVLAPGSAGVSPFGDVGARAIMSLVAVYVAVVIVVRLRHGVPGPDVVALTARGLLLSAAGAVRYVPWVSVRSVERRDLRGAPTLAVVADSPEAIKRSGGAGLLDGIGAVFIARDQVAVALRSLALPPDAVVALVQQVHENARSAAPTDRGHGSADSADPAWFDQLVDARQLRNRA